MADEEDVAPLISIIEDVAQGHYDNRVMAFTRPEHPERIRRVAEAVAMMMVKVEAREFRLEQLIEELKEANRRLRENAVKTVTAIAGALGARDRYTEGHAVRVARYGERLAKKLELPEEEVEFVRVGGMLHDIGKIGFSDRLFANQDTRKPTKEMFDEIRKHPTAGYEILKHLDFIGPALDYVHYHHERLDGRGYPCGLKGDAIPVGAQIISVADCFDAMTTDRPYQNGRPVETAFKVLREIAESGVSPVLVDAFIDEIRENGME